MRQTAIYVRQSVDRIDSVSLETQEALCRQDVAADETVVVYQDRGYSGKDIRRPGLSAMLDAVACGTVGRVLVYRLDRISRNLADFTRLLERFARHGVAFQSHTERFETASPMGQAMQSLLMVFAQLERETICGRVRDAAFSRAKNGFDTGGLPPIGFQKVATTRMGRRTQMLAADARAPQVAAAFSAYLSADASLSTLAAAWNCAGLLTARGKAWQPNTLARVLRNPVYVRANGAVYQHLANLGATLCVPDPPPTGNGIYLYADRRICRGKRGDLQGVYAIAAPHEGLVAPELWLACQEKLRGNRDRRTLGHGMRTWLSGQIYCANCGSAMTVVTGRSAEYLVCAGKKRNRCQGAGATWRLETAEALVAPELSKRLNDLPLADVEPTEDATIAQARAEWERLQLRRVQLTQSLTALTDPAVAVIAEAIVALDKKCELLAASMEARASPRRQPQRVRVWESLTVSQKKTVLRAFTHGIWADGETLRLYWRWRLEDGQPSGTCTKDA